MLETFGNRVRIQNLVLETPVRAVVAYQPPTTLTEEQWLKLGARYQAKLRSYDSLDMAIELKYGFPNKAAEFKLEDEYLTTYHRFTGRISALKSKGADPEDEALDDYARRLASVKLMDPEKYGKINVSAPTWNLMLKRLDLFREANSFTRQGYAYLARDLKVIRPESASELGFNKDDAQFYQESFIEPDEILTGSFTGHREAAYRFLYGEFDFALPGKALLSPDNTKFAYSLFVVKIPID